MDVNTLRSKMLFLGLSDPQLKALAGIIRTRTFRPGDGCKMPSCKSGAPARPHRYRRAQLAHAAAIVSGRSIVITGATVLGWRIRTAPWATTGPTPRTACSQLKPRLSMDRLPSSVAARA